MQASKNDIEKYSDTRTYPTRTEVLSPHQRYVDDPIYVVYEATNVVKAIELLLKRRIAPTVKEVTGYKRFILNWC